MTEAEIYSFPLLATERLLLRCLEISDADALRQLRSDDRVNEFLDRPKSVSPEEVLQFIGRIRENLVLQKSFYWIIAEKQQGHLIGTICLWNISQDGRVAELGYELHPDHQGKGLMREAVTAVLQFGFERRKFEAITALTHPENQRSMHLLLRQNFHPDTAFSYVTEEERKGMNVYYLLARDLIGFNKTD